MQTVGISRRNLRSCQRVTTREGDFEGCCSGQTQFNAVVAFNILVDVASFVTGQHCSSLRRLLACLSREGQHRFPLVPPWTKPGNPFVVIDPCSRPSPPQKTTRKLGEGMQAIKLQRKYAQVLSQEEVMALCQQFK
jgi:hypothetical protein